MQASIDGKGYSSLEKTSKDKSYRLLTEESLHLQPLCDEVIKFTFILASLFYSLLNIDATYDAAQVASINYEVENPKVCRFFFFFFPEIL